MPHDYGCLARCMASSAWGTKASHHTLAARAITIPATPCTRAVTPYAYRPLSSGKKRHSRALHERYGDRSGTGSIQSLPTHRGMRSVANCQ